MVVATGGPKSVIVGKTLPTYTSAPLTKTLPAPSSSSGVVHYVVDPATGRATEVSASSSDTFKAAIAAGVDEASAAKAVIESRKVSDYASKNPALTVARLQRAQDEGKISGAGINFALQSGLVPGVQATGPLVVSGTPAAQAIVGPVQTYMTPTGIQRFQAVTPINPGFAAKAALIATEGDVVGQQYAEKTYFLESPLKALFLGGTKVRESGQPLKLSEGFRKKAEAADQEVKTKGDVVLQEAARREFLQHPVRNTIALDLLYASELTGIKPGLFDRLNWKASGGQNTRDFVKDYLDERPLDKYTFTDTKASIPGVFDVLINRELPRRSTPSGERFVPILPAAAMLAGEGIIRATSYYKDVTLPQRSMEVSQLFRDPNQTPTQDWLTGRLERSTSFGTIDPNVLLPSTNILRGQLKPFAAGYSEYDSREQDLLHIPSRREAFVTSVASKLTTDKGVVLGTNMVTPAQIGSAASWLTTPLFSPQNFVVGASATVGNLIGGFGTKPVTSAVEFAALYGIERLSLVGLSKVANIGTNAISTGKLGIGPGGFLGKIPISPVRAAVLGDVLLTGAEVGGTALGLYLGTSYAVGKIGQYQEATSIYNPWDPFAGERVLGDVAREGIIAFSAIRLAKQASGLQILNIRTKKNLYADAESLIQPVIERAPPTTAQQARYEARYEKNFGEAFDVAQGKGMNQNQAYAYASKIATEVTRKPLTPNRMYPNPFMQKYTPNPDIVNVFGEPIGTYRPADVIIKGMVQSSDAIMKGWSTYVTSLKPTQDPVFGRQSAFKDKMSRAALKVDLAEYEYARTRNQLVLGGKSAMGAENPDISPTSDRDWKVILNNYRTVGGEATGMARWAAKTTGVKGITVDTGISITDPLTGKVAFKSGMWPSIRNFFFPSAATAQLSVKGTPIAEFHAEEAMINQFYLPPQRTPSGLRVADIREVLAGKVEGAAKAYRSSKDVPDLLEQFSFFTTKRGMAPTSLKAYDYSFAYGLPESRSASYKSYLSSFLKVDLYPKPGRIGRGVLDVTLAGTSSPLGSYVRLGGTGSKSPSMFSTVPTVPYPSTDLPLFGLLPSIVITRPPLRVLGVQSSVPKSRTSSIFSLPSVRYSSNVSFISGSPISSLSGSSSFSLSSSSSFAGSGSGTGSGSTSPSTSTSGSLSISPSTSFIPELFRPNPPNIGALFGKKPSRQTRRAPKRQYQPSIAAEILGIKDFKEPRRLTGIEIRPVLPFAKKKASFRGNLLW